MRFTGLQEVYESVSLTNEMGLDVNQMGFDGAELGVAREHIESSPTRTRKTIFRSRSGFTSDGNFGANHDCGNKSHCLLATNRTRLE